MEATPSTDGMKILLLDVETAPHIAYVWSLFDKFVPIDRVIESGYTMCWAAKWYGEDGVLFDSIQRNTERGMLENIHDLMSEADAVCHYNGSRFDIPTLNKEFLVHGMKPPAPYKQIDLLQTARRRFRLASNKLDFVAKELGLAGKVAHKGMALWRECMAGNRESWATMEEYNVQDVVLLEQVYDRLKPWIIGHPNHGTFSGNLVCPNCGGHRFQKRGYAYTAACKYQRYQCNDCGAWFKDNKNLHPVGAMKFTQAKN